MRLTVLGCHSPFPGPSQATPGYLLEIGGRRILLDCGTGVVANLQHHAGVDSLDMVIVSHLHPDHSADLITLGFALLNAKMGGKRAEPLPIYLPPGGTELVELLANRQGNLFGLFAESWKLRNYTAGEIVLDDLRIRFFPTGHAMNCHGVRLTSRDGAFAYTGDSAYTPELIAGVEGVDLLLAEAGGISPEQARATNHMQPHETGNLAQQARVGQLVVTHFLPGTDLKALRDTAARAFFGPVLAAEEGLVVEMPQQGSFSGI